jgi:hypothetical protein
MARKAQNDEVAESVGYLARTLAEVRRETGAETIELRGRFRIIEQRLTSIEEQQARLLALLEGEEEPPETRDFKSDISREELTRMRQQKRADRAARAAQSEEAKTAEQPEGKGAEAPSRATSARDGRSTKRPAKQPGPARR